MQLLDRERAERTTEQQAFATERQNRLQHASMLTHQLEGLQQEYQTLQRNLTDSQERLAQTTAILETLNATLDQREKQIQETGHTLEIMQVRLKTEIDLRQRLEQEAAEMRTLLKDIMTRRDHKKLYEK